jgi:hypothetical protein
MKSTKTILAAALGLVMGAITAQTAEIQITSFPYNISVPGTYVLTSNLSANVRGWFPITVNSAVAGPIIIDLKGFTLSVTADNIGAIYIENNSTASSITIRNGTIQGSTNGILTDYGVVVNEDIQNGIPTTNYVSNIKIEKITFGNFYTAVELNQTNSSSITDCSFTSTPESEMIGIVDIASQGGNTYKNDSFDGNEDQELVVEGAHTYPFAAGPVVLKNCGFEAAAKAKAKQ